MTAKSKPGPRGQEKAIEPSHEAETEKDAVGEAKPVERKDATQVANDIVGLIGNARADGNRITVTYTHDNGLVQTFHATVEEGIREF